LLADLRHDFVLAWRGGLTDLSLDDFRNRAEDMRANGASLLEADGFETLRQRHDFTVDMRYVGQSFTLSVTCDPETTDWDLLRAGFGRRHAETFGHSDAEHDVEMVNIRLVSYGLVDKPELKFSPERAVDLIVENRRVWFGDDWTDCPIYDRAAMPAGFGLTGPAIIEEAGGTSVVPPNWRVTVHSSGALDCCLPRGA